MRLLFGINTGKKTEKRRNLGRREELGAILI